MYYHGPLQPPCIIHSTLQKDFILRIPEYSFFTWTGPALWNALSPSIHTQILAGNPLPLCFWKPVSSFVPLPNGSVSVWFTLLAVLCKCFSTIQYGETQSVEMQYIIMWGLMFCILCQVIWNTWCFDRNIAQALLYFMSRMATKDFIEPMWILAVPLLHFLDDYIKPGGAPRTDQNHRSEKWWGISNFRALVDSFKALNAKTM